MIKNAHILPLTGLRFFAAASIVILHAAERWPPPQWIAELALNQGVSFFFVLSGFILTYVYRALPTGADVRGFYVARLARIWPVHIAATLLMFVLMPQYMTRLSMPDGPQITLAYVTLTHAWVPLWDYFLAFNGVSWTISTELFFYLTFPLFVVSWGRWNSLKIPAAALPALAIILYINIAKVPATEWTPGLTVHGLVYIFPLSRLVEFVCGVVAAQIWLSRADKREWSQIKSTAMEVVALVAVYLAMRYCRPLADTQIVNAIGGVGGAHWLRVNGFTPAFVLMVYIFACSRGPVAAFLGSRLMFRLGEISFSLYMVHSIVLLFFGIYAKTIAAHVPINQLLAYWLACMACAYCMWRYVEAPMRRSIINFYNRKPLEFSTWLRGALESGGRLVAPLLTVFLVTTLVFSQPEIETVASPLPAMTYTPAQPVSFGGQYELVGVLVTPYGNTKNIDFFIRAIQPVKLDKDLAVHVLDAADTMIGNTSTRMDIARSTIPTGTTWRIRSVMPAAWYGQAKSFGLLIYDTSGTVALSAGSGDWDGRRYRFTLP